MQGLARLHHYPADFPKFISPCRYPSCLDIAFVELGTRHRRRLCCIPRRDAETATIAWHHSLSFFAFIAAGHRRCRVSPFFPLFCFFFRQPTNQPTNQLLLTASLCFMYPVCSLSPHWFHHATFAPSPIDKYNAISNFGLAFFMCNLSFISHLTIFCTSNGRFYWQHKVTYRARRLSRCRAGRSLHPRLEEHAHREADSCRNTNEGRAS